MSFLKGRYLLFYLDVCRLCMPTFLLLSLEFYLVLLKTFDCTPEIFATHDSATVAFSNKVFFTFLFK